MATMKEEEATTPITSSSSKESSSQDHHQHDDFRFSLEYSGFEEGRGQPTTTTTTFVGFVGKQQQQRWMDQEDGALLLTSLEYLDTVSLIQKKSISKLWQSLCIKVIDDKCQGNKKKKAFESNKELQLAVHKYCGSDNNKCTTTADATEEIASTYGYPIDKWDVSNIQDFSCIFEDHFNEPIGSWGVSNATTMYGMFANATSFNQDISSWDVSNAKNMSYMFCNARSFNKDISSWNVSNVTDMVGLFYHAYQFNQPIGSWDVANVTTMYAMFGNATSFNQDLSSWDVSSVLDMGIMFGNAFSFNQDLSTCWDVSNVDDWQCIFSGSSVTDVERMPRRFVQGN